MIEKKIKRDAFVLELNEFEFDSDWQIKFPKFAKQIPSHFTVKETLPDMDEEFAGLDPWVQWPTIHNLMTTKCHEQLRHGQTIRPDQIGNTIFSKFSQQSKKFVAWGIMNPGHKVKAPQVLLADPWSENIQSQPKELEEFLEPMRYLATNYHKPNIFRLASSLSRASWYVIRSLLFCRLIALCRDCARILVSARSINSSVQFMLFELASCYIFSKFIRQNTSIFLFINSAAHFQHNHRHCQRTQRALDFFLGRVCSISSQAEIFKQNLSILTALTQESSEGSIVYNFQNTTDFLRDVMMVDPKNAVIGMTSEIFITIEDPAAIRRFELLKNVKIDGRDVFLIDVVRADASISSTVFIQVIIDKPLAFETTLEINGETYGFFDLFYRYRERTGRHIRKGYWVSDDVVTNRIRNEDLLRYVFC